MSFTNIKRKSQNERGFTIVELLIVVVVIAILAAITIVSYNGITNRANQSAAKSTAATAQKKVELYQSENGRYPIAASELSSDQSDSWYLASSSFGSTAPDSSTGKNYVRIQGCMASAGTLSASTVTGIRIGYWNYGEGGGSPTVANLDLGEHCADHTADLN